MSEQIDRLARLSGEGQERAPKYSLPLLKFNGNTGDFCTCDLETKEETPLKKPIQITILKRRKALSAFTTNHSYFTNEYNSTTQKVCLYKNLDGTVTHEDTDIPANLRTKYPGLKTKEIVYCLYDGVVYKLDIKGASLSAFWDFTKKLSEEDKHSFQIVIEINSEKVVEKGKIPYCKMTFTNAGESDLDAVEEHLPKVAEETGKVDAYFAKKVAGEFQASLKKDESIAADAKAEREFNAMGVDYPNEETGEITF
jgi:hypothetical protein